MIERSRGYGGDVDVDKDVQPTERDAGTTFTHFSDTRHALYRPRSVFPSPITTSVTFTHFSDTRHALYRPRSLFPSPITTSVTFTHFSDTRHALYRPRSLFPSPITTSVTFTNFSDTRHVLYRPRSLFRSPITTSDCGRCQRFVAPRGGHAPWTTDARTSAHRRFDGVVVRAMRPGRVRHEFHRRQGVDARELDLRLARRRRGVHGDRVLRRARRDARVDAD